MASRALQRVVKTSAAALDILRPPRRGLVVLTYHRIGLGSSLELDLNTGLWTLPREATKGDRSHLPAPVVSIATR